MGFIVTGFYWRLLWPGQFLNIRQNLYVYGRGIVKLFINGKETIFENIQNAQDVMKQTGMIENKAALAVNGQFIPRSHYFETHIQDGDALEIISPMQGG